MTSATLLEQIGRKRSDKAQAARQVIQDPRLLPEVFRGLEADKAAVRFGCAGVLLAISESQPRLLYPHWDRLAEMTDSPNSILQWTAYRALANLAPVDSEGRMEGFLNRYFAPVPGPAMITAATVIAGGGRIAQAKPHLADVIAAKILGVQRARYKTAECRNVAIGHAIEALEGFFGLLKKPRPVLQFVRRQLRNRRNAVRKKAAAFLKANLRPRARTRL